MDQIFITDCKLNIKIFIFMHNNSKIQFSINCVKICTYLKCKFIDVIWILYSKWLEYLGNI